ncbi:hypothetical protein EG329_013221 [Mollisiaceae sp. DMI_Dod_QoI]|nr:hypothetical protein EG329_013221 [Helotiales sp. DMI_Dod_QoI]
MVLLGGLELVAAGYIIHKHQQNKRDKQRLDDEAAALEEEQYHLFPPDDGRNSRSDNRRRRSHSRRRHSYDRYDRHDRPHSHDGKYRRESPSPRPKPILKPTNYSNPQLAQQRPPPYNAALATPPMAAAQRPAPQAQPQPQPAPQSYPQDIKYGWTDDQPSQQRPPQNQNYPPTGWPAEWQQSQGAGSSSRPPQPRQTAESSRGRSDRRPEDSPRVHFAAPRHSPSVRSLSQSPPPSYRA